MTSEKLIEAFRLYLEDLRESGAEPIEMPEDLKFEFVKAIPVSVVLNHMAYMCETAIGFVEAGRTEKAMRWLGFLQGASYLLGTYSIDDLKEHSRPRDDNVSEDLDHYSTYEKSIGQI